MGILQVPHCKQSIQRVRKIIIKRLTQIPNAIIAIKRVTWLVTVGLKEAERKVKGQRAGKDQTEEINQIRHRRQIQILMMSHIWHYLIQNILNLTGILILLPHPIFALNEMHLLTTIYSKIPPLMG